MLPPSRQHTILGAGVLALAIVLAFLAPAAFALPRDSASTGGKPHVVVQNGDAAMMSGLYEAEEGHLCGFYVDVGTGGSPKTPTTYLYLSLETWDPDAYPCDGKECPPPCEGEGCPPPPGACTYFGGWYSDQLPNGQFTRTGLTYGLQTTVEVYPYDTCEKEGCPPPDPAPDPISVSIDLTWKRSSSREYSYSGTETYRGPDIVRRSSGRWTTYSALGSGTLLGSAVSPRPGEETSFAAVGSFHQTSVCRSPADTDLCSGGY